ncbi:MAG TPA: metallophosphoesterase, partial [Deinococcales bacterium]|nr:metallophosphoesterase [Deinococcales bacterium]
MRTLVLGDIHANAPALEAVLAHARAQRFDDVVFVGDAVGYGPHPVEVLDWLQALNARCVLGNHDVWLIGLAGGGNARELGSLGPILSRH